MGTGKTDEIKGRAKEAAGAVTDDDRLRREGKVDQAAGKVKEKAGDVVDKVREAVNPKSDRDRPR
ncbi:MAG: CsbD family protein [Proteobacteria bacterium]|nr:MAG: CsbD family protein [Pseudomonadota bacterium]